ncbi:MAG: family 1 encapsulin nanocompartment shell protein [Sulfuricella sp.]|nr:family 1 encapsulin nanocompartment shell protein [Sulfuricella sp.]
MNNSSIPFDAALLARMEQMAVAEARKALTARRFLPVDGPFGLGYLAAPVGNDDQRQHASHGATTIISRTIPVPLIFRHFVLGRRRVAAYTETGQPLDLSPLGQAALEVAGREEELIYMGDAEFGLAGLCTVEGRNHLDGGDWTDVEQVLRDVLAAVTRLDTARFHGPYALALEPRLYNNLFRRYPEGSDLLQIDHLKELCTNGIHKTAIQGAVLVAPEAGTLLIGEDLTVDFTFPDSAHFNFAVRESVVLRIDAPKAICTIKS